MLSPKADFEEVGLGKWESIESTDIKQTSRALDESPLIVCFPLRNAVDLFGKNKEADLGNIQTLLLQWSVSHSGYPGALEKWHNWYGGQSPFPDTAPQPMKYTGGNGIFCLEFKFFFFVGGGGSKTDLNLNKQNSYCEESCLTQNFISGSVDRIRKSWILKIGNTF